MLQTLYYVSLIAVLCLFISGGSNVQLRKVALGGAISTFFVSLLVGPSLLERSLFFASFCSWFGSNILFGVDGVSYLFILLSVFLTVVCILVSWSSITYLVKEFLLCLLVLNLFLIILFTAWDLLVFYVFFEALLIPMVLIIGV